MSVIELDSQDLKDLEDGYMLKIKIGNHECGLVGPKWINAETRIQKFMKRQSVEDYVNERFEMKNPVDECKIVDKEEKPKNEPDLVNHPSHYETGKFECIDVMEEALGRDVVKGFCIGNAFKYLYRAKRKNGLEDLKKAQWYLNRVISMEDSDNTKDQYVEQKAILKDLEDEILNETDKSERFV